MVTGAAQSGGAPMPSKIAETVHALTAKAGNQNCFIGVFHEHKRPLRRPVLGRVEHGDRVYCGPAARSSMVNSMCSMCPRAERRSPALSRARTRGSGRLAESSSDSSHSQHTSRLHLSRAAFSPYVYACQRPWVFVFACFVSGQVCRRLWRSPGR
jgi:hypothetical protein